MQNLGRPMEACDNTMPANRMFDINAAKGNGSSFQGIYYVQKLLDNTHCRTRHE